jgi:ABC-type Fe3+-hydroxamate transport system substrate-binding protein
MRALVLLSVALLVAGSALAQEDSDEPETANAEQAAGPNSVKTMSGMSILGNEEAPKSLVIVPWKSSRLGDGLGISNALDETPRAVDRDVFMRELHFYELRSGRTE